MAGFAGVKVAFVFATMVGFGGGSAVWAQAPQLVSSDPPDGATEVSRTTGMVFVFDQPMDTFVRLQPSFPPFLQGNFELSVDLTTVLHMWEWSEDGRTLTGTHFFGEFPPGTVVTWTLNPSGGGDEPLASEMGVPLPTLSGSFTTAGQSTGGGGDDDNCDGLPNSWGAYSIFKSASYEQTSTADPVPAADSPFFFGVSVGAPEAGPALTGGSVSVPGAGTQPLDSAPFTGDLYFFSMMPTEEFWNSAFPAGNYTLRFTQTGQSERVISMDMPSDTVPVPKIANYAEAQSVDAAQDFTLRWNEFTGGGADAQLSITVEDETPGFESVVFEAPNYCVPLELPPSATSVVIPANTLSPDRVYRGTISFRKHGYLSTNAVPEMAGSSGIGKMTSFTLNTGANTEPAIPATLGDLVFLPNGDVQIQLSGTPGRVYQVERTGSLGDPAWTPLGPGLTMDAGGNGVFVDTIAQNVSPLFYRAVAE